MFDKDIRSEPMRYPQYGTLRPHTISNSTFKNKNRPSLNRTTFVPPGQIVVGSSINDNHKNSVHPVTQELFTEQKQPTSSSPSLHSIKSEQTQSMEMESRFSTIRRSCRLVKQHYILD